MVHEKVLGFPIVPKVVRNVLQNEKDVQHWRASCEHSKLKRRWRATTKTPSCSILFYVSPLPKVVKSVHCWERCFPQFIAGWWREGGSVCRSVHRWRRRRWPRQSECCESAPGSWCLARQRGRRHRRRAVWPSMCLQHTKRSHIWKKLGNSRVLW